MRQQASERPRLLMIGDFARRCRLPVSTLRYYDRIGLLAPAAVDPSSGYRRYTAGQVPAAVLIARLRAIGTAPQAIAAVLAGGTLASAALAAERRRLEDRARDAQRALAELDDLLAGRDDAVTHELQLVRLSRHRVAAAPFAGPDADIASCVLRSIAGLRAALRRAGCARAGPWGATFPLEITEQVSGFVFARTSQPPGPPDLATAWLPAARAVRAVHQRGPGTVALAYQAVLDRIDHEGWTPAGPVIEEYLSLDGAPSMTPVIQVTVPLA